MQLRQGQNEVQHGVCVCREGVVLCVGVCTEETNRNCLYSGGVCFHVSAPSSRRKRYNQPFSWVSGISSGTSGPHPDPASLY